MNDEADPVLDVGAFLARLYGAQLHLLHIESTSTARRELEASQNSVNRLFQRVVDTGQNATVRVLSPAVPEGMRSVAVEEKADLVVVVTGRGERQSFGVVVAFVHHHSGVAVSCSQRIGSLA